MLRTLKMAWKIVSFAKTIITTTAAVVSFASFYAMMLLNASNKMISVMISSVPAMVSTWTIVAAIGYFSPCGIKVIKKESAPHRPF